MNYIKYKDITIASNTDAYALYAAKKFGELDEHLRMLEVKRKRLEG